MLITLKQAAAKLKAANKILVTAHVLPDGDAIGSTLAMMQILRAMGKVAQVYIDDAVRKNLHVLPHFEEIRRPADGEKFDADLLLVLDTSPDRIGNVRKLTDGKLTTTYIGRYSDELLKEVRGITAEGKAIRKELRHVNFLLNRYEASGNAESPAAL